MELKAGPDLETRVSSSLLNPRCMAIIISGAMTLWRRGISEKGSVLAETAQIWGVEQGFYGTFCPEYSQPQPFHRRTLIRPSLQPLMLRVLGGSLDVWAFPGAASALPSVFSCSFLLRLSCGAVIPAFEDIFTCTWLFKGFTWPWSSPLVFELDWGWDWVTHCLGLPTAVRFGAIASPATAPCFTSCTRRHLLSGFSDNAFPQSANICHLWLRAPADHPGGVKRGGWP